MNKESLAARLRYLAVTNIAVLIVALVLWRAMAGLSTGDIVLIVVLSAPLFIAAPKVLAGNRRTYAWITLAITPFIVVAITEAVANPASRAWAGLCLTMAFLLFVLSIAYLRVTRDPS